ncbi:hypothetical protein NCS52_00295600 [Fusarium sp. LHS14.1]|nr:hypothetical protein NCS52_00295600 [Fusarium sp. LHS14.1]
MSVVPENEGLQVDYSNYPKQPSVTSKNDPNGNHHATAAKNQQKGPFGLGLWAFAVLVAAVTAIVVGGAVGGGLGAALANCQSRLRLLPPRLANAHCLRARKPRRPDQVNNLTLECPEAGKSREVGATDGYKFDMWCGIDAPYGTRTQDGGTISDIAGLIAYTLDDCLQACIQMRNFNESGHGVRSCESVQFGARLKDHVAQYGSNCWLKDGKKEKGRWERNGMKSYAYAEVQD